jgi:hypothetical protein
MHKESLLIGFGMSFLQLIDVESIKKDLIQHYVTL